MRRPLPFSIILYFSHFVFLYYTGTQLDTTQLVISPDESYTTDEWNVKKCLYNTTHLRNIRILYLEEN